MERYRENLPWYLEQITSCTYRLFTTGFFFGKPDEQAQIYENNTYEQGYTYLGLVNICMEDGAILTEQRNKFSVGEEIEIMKPDGRNIPAEVKDIRDEEGNPMESAPHPKQRLFVSLSEEAQEYDILRRKA